MYIALVSLLLVAILTLSACQDPVPSASAHVPPTSVTTAAEWPAALPLLVDVRTPREFASGHVAGAVNIPLSQLRDRLFELGDRDDPIEVYCRSGNRSSQAAVVLAVNGFTRIANLGSLRAARSQRARR